MANKIQIRRDTTANWTAADPILSQGELGLDTTLNKVKIGNGTSHWSALSFYFDVPNTLENGLHTVELNSTGGVNFPTLSVDIHNGGVQSAQVLKFDKASQQVIITGPTPAAGNSAERIIIQGQRATGNGEGGDVYLWGGDSDINGGDIKIYAGDADSDVSGSIGGYVNIDAGNGFTNGGNLTLSAGVARIVENGYGGNVSITAGYAHNGTPGNIQLSTYAQSNNSVLSWTFTNDGKLQLPTGGDVVNSDGNSITDIYKFAYGTIGTKANPDTSNGWGGYNMYLDPGGESWASIFIPSNAGQDDGAALQITNKGAANSIVQVFGWGGVQLVTNTGSDEKVFEFGDNGTISFPNNKLKTPSSLVVETTSGIPTSVTKTSSNQGWGVGTGLGTNLPTTGGSGTGLTVDVVDTGSAYAGITIHTPGSGYLNGETLTVTNQGMSDTFTVSVPVNNWTFGTDGTLTLPTYNPVENAPNIKIGNTTRIVDTNFGFSVPGPTAGVVYTSSFADLSSMKLLVTIEGIEDNDDEWLHTQVCEMMVVRRVGPVSNIVNSSVYGVVYTGTGPLVTLTAQQQEGGRVNILAQPTNAHTIYVKIHAIEVVRGD